MYKVTINPQGAAHNLKQTTFSNFASFKKKIDFDNSSESSVSRFCSGKIWLDISYESDDSHDISSLIWFV